MRSNRADVRNPVAALPAVAALLALPPEPLAALRAVLLDLGKDARARKKQSWVKGKLPMALYWHCIAVYSRHLAALLRPVPPAIRYLQSLADDDEPETLGGDEQAERCYRCEMPVGLCQCCGNCGAARGACNCWEELTGEPSSAAEVPHVR